MQNKIEALAEKNYIYGVFRHTIEEAAELIQAIGKFEGDLSREHFEAMLGEVADIEIMLAQLKYILENKFASGSGDIIEKIKVEKIERQLKRFGLTGEEDESN